MVQPQLPKLILSDVFFDMHLQRKTYVCEHLNQKNVSDLCVREVW